MVFFVVEFGRGVFRGYFVSLGVFEVRGGSVVLIRFGVGVGVRVFVYFRFYCW